MAEMLYIGNGLLNPMQNWSYTGQSNYYDNNEFVMLIIHLNFFFQIFSTSLFMKPTRWSSTWCGVHCWSEQDASLQEHFCMPWREFLKSMQIVEPKFLCCMLINLKSRQKLVLCSKYSYGRYESKCWNKLGTFTAFTW